MATLEEFYKSNTPKQNKKPQNNGMTLEDFYSGNVEQKPVYPSYQYDSADEPKQQQEKKKWINDVNTGIDWLDKSINMNPYFIAAKTGFNIGQENLDKTIQFIKDLPDADKRQNMVETAKRIVPAGLAQTVSALANTDKMAKEYIGNAVPFLKPVYDWGANIDQKIQSWAEDKLNQNDQYVNEIQGQEYLKDIYGAGKSGVQMGIAALTGPAAPLTFGATAAGQYAREAELEGASRNQQAVYGLTMGLVEGLTEKIPLGNIQKTFMSPFKSALVSYLKNIPDEFIQESAAELASGLAKQFIYKPDQFITNGKIDINKVAQFGNQIIEAGNQGATTAALTGIPGTLYSGTRQTIQNISKKPQNAPQATQTNVRNNLDVQENNPVEVNSRPQGLMSGEEGSFYQAANTGNMINSEEFKKWFEGSKVVDDNGEPLVVYHGTNVDFDSFKDFQHFGSEKAAIDRLKNFEGNKRIIPAFLKIKNPLHVDDTGLVSPIDIAYELNNIGATNIDIKQMIESWVDTLNQNEMAITAKKLGYIDPFSATRDEIKNDIIEDLENGMISTVNNLIYGGDIRDTNKPLGDLSKATEMLISALESEGYDGLKYKNAFEDKGSWSFVAFRPEQIKIINPQNQAGFSISEYVEGRKELPNDVAQLESLLKEVENTPKDRFGFDLQFFAEQIKEKIRKLSKTKSNTINRYVGFDDQTKQFLEDAGFEYDPETNQEQMQRALNNLNTDKADVINRFENDNKAFSDAVQVFEAKKLIDEIYQNKDISKLNDYTKHYAERMRENARALQATDAAWEKTKDPVSAIIKAQRVINNAKKLFEEYGWKGKPPELTDEDIRIIIDQMEAAKGFPDGSYEQQAAVSRVQQLIADKIPKTMRDKLLGLQRISLILNPKTLITRNPLSNVLIQSLESVRENTVGALIDSITSGIRGSKRTQIAAPIQKTRAYLGGVKKGVVEFGKDIKNKVDTSLSRGQAEMPKGRTFKNRFLNELDNITKGLLQIGDRPFYQGAYDSRIKELQLINKTNEITDDMKIDARLYALDKVFQNDSDLSKRANQLKNALGFFGDIAIPFTQTPANVLDKMLDYSPAGLGKALYHLGKTKGGKAFNQKLFVDRLSRSLTGTGIIMIGYVLAAKGLVTGKDDENAKVRNFKRAAGYNPYAFKIGNGFYTFDWAQPFGGMLAAGADAYLGGLGKDDFLSKVTGTAEGLTNTFFNMSFLQGLTRLLSGYSPAASIGNTLLSAPQQAAPTAGKQIAQLIDPVVRETKGNNPFETAKNRVVSRIPFASKTLPAKVDVFGEDIKYYQGRNNFFNVMLNPGFYTELKNDPATKLLLDVYNETGETDVLPKLAPEYINKDGKTIYLTVKQQIEFQKIYGKRLKTELSKLKLNGLTPNAKAKVLSQKVMAIYNLSKAEFMRNL